HHIAEAVAHQHEIDVLIEQLCRVRVIAGEAHDGLLTLVCADFRHGDALGLNGDGHGHSWKKASYDSPCCACERVLRTCGGANVEIENKIAIYRDAVKRVGSGFWRDTGPEIIFLALPKGQDSRPRTSIRAKGANRGNHAGFTSGAGDYRRC